MRFGRLHLGKSSVPSGSKKDLWLGKRGWGYDKAICGCRILSLGGLAITWLDKECKCQACNQYICECSKNKSLKELIEEWKK